MPRVKTPSVCEVCGCTYYRWGGQVNSKYCSNACTAKVRFTQEHNAKVARDTAEHRRQILLDYGSNSTGYRKLYGRHEHRVVAEQMLGRSLLPGEIVHHKDGNKRNNDPSNLEVMTQNEHARRHFTK